jgi:carboxyl-terminal processing protease
MNLYLKRTGVLSVAFVAAMLLCSATYWQLLGKKEEILLQRVTETLRQYHFQANKIDDNFSLKVYDLYIKDIDPNKMFYTKKDMNKLDKYRKLVDDEIEDATFDLFNVSTVLRAERLKQTEGWYKDVLAKPFDFTKDEEFENDDEKRGFAADAAAHKDLWRRSLKYQTLARLSDMIDDQERDAEKKAKLKERIAKGELKDSLSSIKIEDKKPRTYEEMEADARKKVLKAHDDWFKRLKELTQDDLFAIYLNSIASACDPHTSYMAPEQKKDFDIGFSGKLEGIGATLQTKDSYVRVTSLIPGGPAWKTGKIKVDDLITKVAQADKEAVDVTDMGINDVIKMIRGKKGTEVRLTLKKGDGTTDVVSIVRDIVVMEEGFAKSSIIENEGQPRIGYIDLPRFYADFEDRKGRFCAKDMELEVKKLVAENVDGIIIDLRGNGGGSLNDVVEISGQYIDKGPIVQVKSRDAKPESNNDYRGGTLFDGPLVIMVDQYSASASEIMAAALQDYGRAVIVGSKSTFGKGTVQRFFDLDNWMSANNSELKPMGTVKMTTQKFYRINGTTTQLKGVIPDIILPDTYSLIDKYGEKNEAYPLIVDEIAPAKYNKLTGLTEKLPELKKMSEARTSQSKHFQLITEGAKRLKEQRDRTKYSLTLKNYQAFIKDLEQAAKPLRDSNNEPIGGVKVVSVKSDETYIQADSSRISRAKEWHKTLKKDVYVHEACNIVADIIKLSPKKAETAVIKEK